MKLAFALFKYFPHGGLQKKCLRIAKACLARGHSVDIYTMTWEGPCPTGINRVILPQRGLSNHRQCKRFSDACQSQWRSKKYDCIIGFNRMPGLDLYYAADDCFQHLARSHHSMLYRITPRYKTYQHLEAAVMQDPHTQIMYLSPHQALHFQQYYDVNPQRLHRLPPGISTAYKDLPDRQQTRQITRKTLGISDTQKILLLIGSHFHTKGVDRAISALANLEPSLKQSCDLLIMGEGKSLPYQKLARRLGVESRVHFLGAQQHVIPFLLSADLLLHPARHESGGNVLIEALVCQLPVLTTETCGYSHAILKANAGCVVGNPFSQIELNRILANMLHSDKTAWQKNAARYLEQHDVYGLVEAVVQLIESTKL